jgi:hypothetical protein
MDRREIVAVAATWKDGGGLPWQTRRAARCAHLAGHGCRARLAASYKSLLSLFKTKKRNVEL